MADLDPRLTPARPDLAARVLEGRVVAERFVDGRPARVIEGVLPLRRAPRPDAGLDTEALMGETLTIYDEDAEGWSWVQLDRDGRSTTKTPRGGAGCSSIATAMSAGCPRMG
jgi:hypothetical protein